jgi:hypothetical protein
VVEGLTGSEAEAQAAAAAAAGRAGLTSAAPRILALLAGGLAALPPILPYVRDLARL